MQDWNYLKTNDFEITLELGCYKYPPHTQLKEYWDDNREALIAFIERVHTGIKGFVIDKSTGEPIDNIVSKDIKKVQFFEKQRHWLRPKLLKSAFFDNLLCYLVSMGRRTSEYRLIKSPRTLKSSATLYSCFHLLSSS